jgi:hypothetical protein
VVPLLGTDQSVHTQFFIGTGTRRSTVRLRENDVASVSHKLLIILLGYVISIYPEAMRFDRVGKISIGPAFNEGHGAGTDFNPDHGLGVCSRFLDQEVVDQTDSGYNQQG